MYTECKYNIFIFILNSERSDECINWFYNDVFFFLIFYLCLRSQNNASIFNFSIIFGGKLNLVGAFQYFVPGKTKTKLRKNRIFTQNQFLFFV